MHLIYIFKQFYENQNLTPFLYNLILTVYIYNSNAHYEPEFKVIKLLTERNTAVGIIVHNLTFWSTGLIVLE